MSPRVKKGEHVEKGRTCRKYKILIGSQLFFFYLYMVSLLHPGTHNLSQCQFVNLFSNFNSLCGTPGTTCPWVEPKLKKFGYWVKYHYLFFSILKLPSGLAKFSKIFDTVYFCFCYLFYAFLCQKLIKYDFLFLLLRYLQDLPITGKNLLPRCMPLASLGLQELQAQYTY